MKLVDPQLLKQQAFVNGEWTDGESGDLMEVRNPADGELIVEIASVGRKETARAIDAAEEAWSSWRNTTAKERSKILRRWFDMIVENQEDLAQILSAEQGKPLAESRGEILYGASFIEWFAEEAKRTYGDVIPHDKDGRRLVVIKQPVGVVAAITPWNFPNAMITRKVGPALAAGCTVVLKPASETPLSALALAELGARAGLPAGVLNVVPGRSSREIGSELTTNPKVRKLSFTGSTGVGKVLMEQCASTIKKLSLELGGNAPFIVFEDADIDAAVQGAIDSKFRNAGQTCVCTNRILVQNSVAEEFTEKLARAVSELRVGAALEEGVQQGPLINQAAVLKVKEHIDDAVAKGASVVAGGELHDRGGNFFQPTVLSGVTADMLVAYEETFGPLAPVFGFETEEEAVQMANDTEFGLASYIYTRDLARSWRVSEALEYGMVGVNEGLISTEVAPFGGIKQSGLGREGSHYGIDDYVEQKYMCLGIK
ncbi:NAD-dependent succinate-semialdehyde dehydrogenase [Marinobacter sp. GN3S48]|uniref:NAD-dependent succinate-semialdehyde dehydrogenase n=1 Tax=Marinobacter sp. GN3S48 TaxID=3382302 RepID=UPI00387AC607